MDPHSLVSSYLVHPDLTPKRQRHWAGFRTSAVRIKRANPHILPKVFAALMVWALAVGTFQYVTSPHSVPGQRAFSTGELGFGQTALASAVRAETLPAGPSGDVLPPGTMAPYRTYANGYIGGQCTWYVAGRRQVPNGWGHARSWYYHASSSGWSVGSTPAVAAIAWTSSGYYGHVALVEKISDDRQSVLVSEMNYIRPWQTSQRWASASSFKYIY